ncbi:MAG: hypothetical protein COT36_01950 [Parcubacteria group bacterium CG08_land_8_20_14_0_20_38_56]|nr:MAG: hypothetical protein COT36_01950 [Parcubacteria group bacterium CG08_land_8_20_14_0_20_38_56]
MVRQTLKDLIKESLVKLQKQNVLPDFVIPEIVIEHPAEEKNGDYSTNIAMQIVKIVKKPPLEIADAIVSKIEIKDSEFFERILAVQPGFVNFFLSKAFLQKQTAEVFKEDFGRLKIGKAPRTRTPKDRALNALSARPTGQASTVRGRKKVNVEFISANPTGSLHIGNGRGAFFGDALANVLEKAGYKAAREYYINDSKKSNQIQELGKTALGKGETYLTEKLKTQISRLRLSGFGGQAKLTEGEAGYRLAQIIQKDNQKFIEKKLKIKFNKWFSEQKEIFDSGKIEKTLAWLREKKLTYEKEGAVWFKTSEFGDEKDWVIIRSSGEPSYFLSDIAYHEDKIGRKFDKIIDIWGADHQGHVKKMMAAMKMLNYKGELNILISQLVRLKSKIKNQSTQIDLSARPSTKENLLRSGQKSKLSKRLGTIITLEDLIKEVGLDVARFFYLSKSLNSQMEFDLDLAKEQSEKNPVYYIQYAYARIHSIIKKSKIKNQKSKIPQVAEQSSLRGRQIKNQKYFKLLTHSSELNLIRQLIKFPEIVEDTAKDYQVQRLPQYATDLATSFHQFYRDCRVLTKDKDMEKARLSLILATKSVLKNTLDLMGISAPEKM